MSGAISPPPIRCPACGAGHYVAVSSCPFCGAAQGSSEAPPVPPAPAPEPAVPRRDPDPPRQAAPPPPVAPSVAPSPVPSVPRAPRSRPRPARRGSAPRRRRLRLRSAVLAALAIAGLATLALGRREALPAPARIVAGPGWESVALAPFRPAPRLRLTGDGPFSLRLDGERVLRVAPGGTSLRLGTLRGLELRAARGPVTVTLTPRAD